MKKSLLILAVFSVLATACGLNSPNVDATVAAQVAATMQAQPPQQVPVEVPVTVQVPVEVPVTVIVEVTSAVQPTQVVVQPAADTPTPQPPSAAATSAPVVSTNPQDPLAGANPTPVIQEDFLIADYWYEFDTSSGSGTIMTADQNYRLVSKQTENLQWTFNGRKTSNIYLSGTAVVPDTKCKAGDYWGLIFRYKDNANFYVFGVSCDGKYKLLKRLDGLFETIVDFTDSAAIRKLGQKNVLGVRAAGDQISLYANDQFLTTVTDGAFAEGLIGLYVASRLTPNLTVVFDDITVYSINQ
ncbi:MAG: hypothetical protein AAB342_00490 [Chloroflexota bacterium]